MSRTIHGLSHKALKHFRKKSAALPVYWIYVSRMNNEGVAWPSGAGLAKDTGWNKEACLDARHHLIDLEALEEVKDYVRPEWRLLDEAQRKHRQRLDRSEYYRPTGYIVVAGEKYMLLYNGADEASTIDQPVSDGKKRRPSQPPTDGNSDRRQNPPELNSSSELDSSKKNTTATSAGRPVFKAVAKHVFGITEFSGLSDSSKGRIGKLEKIARALVVARLPDADTERIAQLVSNFAGAETFKAGIQGAPNFELKFAAYLETKQTTAAPVNPAHVPFPADNIIEDAIEMPPEAKEALAKLKSTMHQSTEAIYENRPVFKAS